MTQYSGCKDMNQVIKRLIKDGWTFTKNTHGRLTHPSGRYITVSLTPSDRYAYRQLERDVRRMITKLEQEGEL